MSTSKSSTEGKPPFLAFAGDAKDIETLKMFAGEHGWPDGGIHQGDIKTATEFLKGNTAPTLLLVEIPSATEAPGLFDALADVCDPATKVIAIGSINEYSFYCWLMDLGIFSYLLRPLTLQMLEAAYLKSIEPPSSAGKQGKPPGKVIAVMGTRGGVGATTVALNLAGIAAGQTKKSVALVDIDPQEGSVALALDIEPSRGVRDALEKPDRIDSLFIERVMTKPMKNLAVLSAEEALHERINIHDHAADMLVKELRDKFDIVILDIPRSLSTFGRQCLKYADHVVLVTDLMLLSLRDALRVGDMMRESLKMKPPFIVANRTGIAPRQEMQPGDFEKGVNSKIAARVPYAPDIYMPVGTDIPALKNKAHAAVKPLYALAEQLVPETKTRAKPDAGGGFSLFKKKA